MGKQKLHVILTLFIKERKVLKFKFEHFLIIKTVPPTLTNFAELISYIRIKNQYQGMYKKLYIIQNAQNAIRHIYR